jgi:tRNA(fMet)-specific endonuclease VapC
MKPCLLDTDILSLFFRNHPKVVENCNLYLQEYEQLSFSLITYYIDLLIAGVAIANDLVLITHNQKHFGKIEELELKDWTL